MPQAFLESRRQYTKDKVNEYFEILMRKIFIQYIEDEFDVTISFLYCLFRIYKYEDVGGKRCHTNCSIYFRSVNGS